MFPKKDSDPYIKSTGERSTLGQMIGSGGGGGSDIPSHTIADAGKVLMVDDSNNLVWGSVPGGSNAFSIARNSSSVIAPDTNAEEVTT